MKIAFHNVDFRSRTGPNAFCTRLAKQLALMGHELSDPGSRCDVDLINIESHQRPNGRVQIQRLDGIWTRATDDVINAPIRRWYDRSHTVIWQSEYDRSLVHRRWGVRAGYVIHNGCSRLGTLDDSIMARVGALSQVVFCSIASWHAQKRLRANVEFMRSYGREHGVKTCLIVIGGSAEALPGQDVFYCGDADPDMCASILKASRAMVHLAWRDHCPNAVVESLSLGTPVICATSGGTRELLTDQSGVIICDRADSTIDSTTFDFDAPPDIDVSGYVTIPEKDSFQSDFSIERAALMYESVMKEALDAC